MPVVRKEEWVIPQPDLSTMREKMPIKFTSRDGKFSMKVPEHIRETLDTREQVYSETIEGVEREMKSLFARYRKLLQNTKRRKVILVYYGGGAYAMRTGEDGHRYCRARVGNTQDNADGIPKLKMDYRVGYEIEEGSKKQYYDDDMRCVRPPSWNWGGEEVIIDWTEDREAFFRDTKYGFEELIIKFFEFIDGLRAFPDTVDTLIKNTPLLPAPEEK